MSGKNRLNRRQFLIAGSHLVAGSVLASCAPKTATPKAEAVPTEAPAAAGAPTATQASVEDVVNDKMNQNLEELTRLSQEKVNLTGYSSPLYVAVDVKSFNDQIFDKKMEELTNVHIGWQTAADWGDAPLELLMASGQLPDVVAGYGLTTFARYGQKGALEPLNQHIEDNVYLKGWLEKKPKIRALITAPDGNIYTFPRILEDAQSVFGGFIIRQDWLDEIGMAIPETIEEYHTVLTELKKKDSKRFPLSGYANSLNYLIWQWGVGSRGPNCTTDFYHEGAKVGYGPVQPAYKEALVFLNQLWKEELIDPEFMNLGTDPAMYYQRWTDGIVGVGYSWADDIVSTQKVDKNINVVGMRPPAGPYGHRETLSNHMEVDPTMGSSIAKSTKNAETAAKYMDLYYSDSGATLMNWGLYGDHYTEKDGEKFFTDKVLKDEKLGAAEYMWNWVSPYWIGAMVCLSEPYLKLYSGNAGDALKLWSQAPWETIKFPPVMLSDDENNRVQQVMTDINTLLDENVAAFITGTKNLESDFDGMVDTLDGMGIGEITSIYQTAYDRFLANMAS
jgi:putative aldouronate transport system substrate-binding protein